MPTVTPPGLLERCLRAAGYLATGAVGIWVLLFPPSSIGDALGQTLTVLWALFMLTAIPAAGAAILGLYRGEYACLPWFAGGLLIAVLHLWIVTTGRHQLTPEALLLSALLLSFAVRFVTLHRLVRIRKGDAWNRTK